MPNSFGAKRPPQPVGDGLAMRLEGDLAWQAAAWEEMRLLGVIAGNQRSPGRPGPVDGQMGDVARIVRPEVQPPKPGKFDDQPGLLLDHHSLATGHQQ